MTSVVIAIPYYNGRQYLAAAIRSALDGAGPAVRVVVVDDASDDSPLDILEAFADKRLSYVRNSTRLGMVGNHNRCLEFNTARFFKILSQDDELLPGGVDAQIAALNAHPMAVLAAGPREIIRPDGRTLFTADHRLRGLVDRNRACQALAWAGTNVIGEPASVLIRGDVLRRGARFPDDPPWLLDVLMWLQLMEHGPALMADAPVARFRLSAQSYSVGLGQRQVAVFRQFLDGMAEKNEIGPWLCRFGKARCGLNAVLRKWIYQVVGA